MIDIIIHSNNISIILIWFLKEEAIFKIFFENEPPSSEGRICFINRWIENKRCRISKIVTTSEDTF